MAKRCKHDFTRLRFKDGSERQGLAIELSHGVVRDASCPAIPFRIDFLHSVKCDDCGAQLSLGPSNEAPVAVEIRAAEMLAGWMHDQKTLNRRGFCAMEDRYGWEAHGDLETPHDDEVPGWLAREIATHDDREARDAEAWPWDVTRPIAEQQGEIECMLEDTPLYEDDEPPSADPVPQADSKAICTRDACASSRSVVDQTRHDIAASVARHADHPVYVVVSCIGEPTEPRTIDGRSSWPSVGAAAEAVGWMAEHHGWAPDEWTIRAATPTVDAARYEAERAAEPDCRDEDDETCPTCHKLYDAHDQCECKVDPATKFGELAQQVVVTLSLLDGHAICPGCDREVDTDTCHCGSATDVHGIADGHTPVPMGCVCHQTAEERSNRSAPAPAYPSSAAIDEAMAELSAASDPPPHDKYGGKLEHEVRGWEPK